MNLLSVLLINAGAIAAMMFALWAISLRRRDVSIVDIFWGLGFVVVAWITCLTAPGESARRWLLTGLTTVWGLRLASYLAWRKHGKPEDYRYRAMRDAYGERFRWISLFLVFGLQGVIMWIVAMPIQAGQSSAAPWHWLDGLGHFDLDRRLFVRDCRRPSAGSVQVRPGESRPGDGPRAVAIHAAPQLFRRFPRLVGVVLDRRGWRRMVDGVQPRVDVGTAGACIRRGVAGEIAQVANRRLRDLCATHKFVFSLAAEEGGADRVNLSSAKANPASGEALAHRCIVSATTFPTVCWFHRR